MPDFFFVGAVGTFNISNDRPLHSLAGPTHPQPDGHYLLDSLGASQSRAPDYSMSEVYASTRGRAQWYRVYRVVQLRVQCHTYFNNFGLVIRGIEPAIIGLGMAVFPMAPGGTVISHYLAPNQTDGYVREHTELEPLN